MLSLYLPLSALLAQAAPVKPVVAVFPIEDRRGQMSADQASQLTDYFSAKIAELGRFLVVPRSDIEATLAKQKGESYKACYDEACQIEIGKELSAQKVLHTRIIQVGNACAITSTLYDLRLSAAERAATKKGACDSDALVTALEAVAATLTTGLEAKAPKKQRVPEPTTHSLALGSSPNAQVLVEGEAKGQTPIIIKLPSGKAQRIELQRQGYRPFEQTVTLDRDQHLKVKLQQRPTPSKNRIEWFGLSVSAGASLTGAVDLSAWIRAINVHFGAFTLTALEASGGVLLTREVRTVDDCNNSADLGYCRSSAPVGRLYAGARVGYRFTFGQAHHVELSVGGGFASTVGSDQRTEDRFRGGAITPRLLYQHLGAGPLAYGAALRVIAPILSKNCNDEFEQKVEGDLLKFAVCTNRRPLLFVLEVPIGWYF